jgi:hypothetical protein
VPVQVAGKKSKNIPEAVGDYPGLWRADNRFIQVGMTAGVNQIDHFVKMRVKALHNAVINGTGSRKKYRGGFHFSFWGFLQMPDEKFAKKIAERAPSFPPAHFMLTGGYLPEYGKIKRVSHHQVVKTLGNAPFIS